MSVVVGFSFPEEAVIISDSRISFVNGEAVVGSKDDLRKIFPLTPYLAIGFTSENVDLTLKIISKLEVYIRDQAKVNIVYYLLQKLPKVAEYEYKKLTKSMTKLPGMEFMFAGILSDRALNVPEPIAIDIMTKGGGGAVPEPIGRALMTMKNGYLRIDPPTPVIMKQRLPSGEVSNLGTWTVAAIGSGSSIQSLFEKEYSRIMTSEPAPIGSFRSNFIRIICDDFIKKSHIPTVGGAVQVLRINAKGVSGVNSSFKRIFSDSSIKDISSMEFDGEKWISKNYETGTTKVIKSYFPPIIKVYSKTKCNR